MTLPKRRPLSRPVLRLTCSGLALFIASAIGTARAHDLALDQIRLVPDLALGKLRGQVTLNPHLVAPRDDAVRVRRQVIALLRQALVVEIDGQPCRPTVEVRELWVRAGATLGDIVLWECALPRTAALFKVFAGNPLPALVVSVEARSPDGVVATESVLVNGGSWSPAYAIRGGNRAWRPGGPTQYEDQAARTDSVPAGGEASDSEQAAPPPPPTSSAPPVGFATESLARQAARYVGLGFQHIIPRGWDHVLFVVGLVLGMSREKRRLLVAASAFTLAHALTLALGALDLVVLPSRFVEALIAFSISYVALENLWATAAASRRRVFVAFAFGLIHGQGFAAALSELSLPRGRFAVSLLSFNCGVELGQLTVIGVTLGVLTLFRDPPVLARYAVRPGSWAIAIVGLVWGIKRLVA